MSLSNVNFKVKSASTGGYVTFGHAFAKGDVPNGKFVKFGHDTDLFGTQCDILNRWDDGSAKFALMSRGFQLTANTEKTYRVELSDTNAAGTAQTLTDAELASAVTSAGDYVVDLGVLGNWSLAAAITTGNKLRTRITGPVMCENHYAVDVDSLNKLIFTVKYDLHGGIYVDWVLHNGYMTGAGANRTYNLKIRTNSVELYALDAVNQRHHTRVYNPLGFTRVGVASITAHNNNKIIPKHDGAYLRATKLVPNFYTDTAPSDSALSVWEQAYVPMGRANLRSSFGATGYDDQIGLLPRWDALHVVSGDPRTFNAVIANARSGGSYSIHFMDAATKKPWAFSTSPNWWAQEVGGSGGEAWSHDTAHQPSIGYLAYLLTGNYFHMEEVQYWATFNGGTQSYSADNRQGAKCILVGIARAQAWGMRTLAQAACITPDGDNLQTEFANSYRENMKYRKDVYITGTQATSKNGPNNLGVMGLYAGGVDGDAYSPGDSTWVDSPWMQAFNVSALAHTYNMEVPLQSTADRLIAKEVRDFSFKHPVGLFGGAGGRPYPYASLYSCVYGTTATANELNSNVVYPASWAEQWTMEKAWQAVQGTVLTDPPITLGSPLLGSSGGAPSAMAGGYWGNQLPSLAYAVEAGFPGAAAAWERFTSASNFAANVVQFGDIPQFGVMPMSIVDVPVEEPEQPSTPVLLHTYTVAAGKTIYMGQMAEVIVDPDMPAWRPPSPNDGTALFTDIPMTNNAIDVNLNGLYAPNSTMTAFTFWGGGAMLKDAAPLGKLAFHAAGHYTNGAEPDIQMTLLINFSTLTWEVANLPPAPNRNDSANPPFVYPDGTHSNPHTYLGLHDYPAEWGGSAHSLAQFCYGGSGGQALNLLSVYDTAMNVHGYRIEPTNQPEHTLNPAVLSFRPDAGASGGNYPVFCRDENAWWGMTNGEISYTLRIDGPTKEVTQFPALGGNNQDSALVSIPSKNMLIGIDGGYSEGWYASNAPRRLYICNTLTKQVTGSLTLGPLPTAGQGYGGPESMSKYHMPGKMGLHWVEELGAIFGLDDSTDANDFGTLYKLSPPETGSWFTGQWTWSVVPTSVWTTGNPTPNPTPYLRKCLNSVWSKIRWNPKLKGFVYCVANNVKPQLIVL